MSPDPKAEQERDDFEYDPPRSIFAATWFRALLVLIVVGVAGAVAVPYALDWMNQASAPPTTASVQSAPLPVAPPATPGQPPASADATTTEPGAPGGAITAAVPAPAAESSSPSPAPAREPATTAPTDQAPASAPSGATPAPSGSAAKAGSEPSARKPARAPRAVAQAAAGAAGAWWVQVGAFKDAQTAQRVAEKLRAANFQVQESAVTRTAPVARPGAATPASGAATEQYDVFVTGVPAPELTGRLTTKGLASEASGSGVVVRPSLPLRDAVALSKDLAAEGLKVQVRRAGGDAGVSPSAAPAAGAGETLHRVRVGGFADRAAASAAMRELEAKGFKGFVARGGS